MTKPAFVFAPALAAVLASRPAAVPAQTATVDKPKGVPVTTAAVETRDLDDTLMLTGTLRPRAQVQVVAEVQARLLRVVRDEGMSRGRGRDPGPPRRHRLSPRLDRAKAAQAVAEANKAHAVAEKERADNLLKTGGITDKDHLSAQVALQVAEAQMAQVKAEVAIAAQQLARTQIKAPFAGRVAKRMADPGTMLANGTPLFTLVDDAVLEFRASVPSADYGKVKRGRRGRRDRGRRSRGRPVKGKVARVSAPRGGAHAVVRGRGPGPRGQRSRGRSLRPRIGGRGQGEERAGRAPRRPRPRRKRPPLAQAFVVTDGKAERKKVTLGVETADAIQVKAGLKAGDIVVLDPPVALSSGAPVELQAARK